MGNWELERQAQGLDKAEEVRMRGEGSSQLAEGIPMMEYTRASLQPCIRCGADPREAGLGIGLNRRVVAQVLVLDTICSNCLTDDERDQMNKDIADAEKEGDSGY